MKLIQPQNAASLQVTVTSVATVLSALMDTAGGNRTANFYSGESGAGILVIKPSDGDVRCINGVAPTASLGIPLSEGGYYKVPMDDIANFYLISVSGLDVICDIHLAKSFGHTDFQASAGGGLTTLSSFDESSGADKVTEIAPIYTHHNALLNVEVTNETNATINRYVDVSGYDKVKVQFDGVAGTDSITLTMEESMQDDGTVAASAAYQDISQYGVAIRTAAATAASYTADAGFEIDVKGVKFLNLKTVSAGGANDGDYNLYVREAY